MRRQEAEADEDQEEEAQAEPTLVDAAPAASEVAGGDGGDEVGGSG